MKTISVDSKTFSLWKSVQTIQTMNHGYTIYAKTQGTRIPTHTHILTHLPAPCSHSKSFRKQNLPLLRVMG